MNRRQFLKSAGSKTILASASASLFSSPLHLLAQETSAKWIDADRAMTWEEVWEKNILGELHQRYCDKENGEEIGWLISHFLNGFYYGYEATGESKWVSTFVDWADSWVRRAVQEPDGFIGWPKVEAAGTDVDQLNIYDADSMLGEAMALRPMVLMASRMLGNPVLAGKYSAKAASYIDVSKRIFEKWDRRGAWRETANAGGISVVLPFGIDKANGKWTDGYQARNQPGHGFSIPNNKANEVARWHLAMHDATNGANPEYKNRAEKWFRLLKSRLHTREEGKYFVWNYWEPAGPWDYKANGSTKHWVGVHPNGGYYEVDVTGIAAAYQHGLVFSKEDIERLIATNRDFMWNHQVEGAKFQRIDGGEAAEHWKDRPGMLWTALLPYDQTLRKIFLANHKPDSWGAISTTPWFLSLAQRA